jgi:hypothetical protein
MSRRFWRSSLVGALLVGLVVWLGPVTSGQEPSATTALLQAAGNYLNQFRRDASGVVIEEAYLQQARAQVLMARDLRSDLAVIADPGQGWIEFRDVYSVDGKPVGDRTDRVVTLFEKPNSDSLEQAKRIVREGARFNLVPAGIGFDRTLNLPMAALLFLRTGNQSRSTFRLDGHDSVAGHGVSVLRFRETGKPRMIGTPDEAAAQGAFWVVPTTGEVLRTELTMRTRKGTTDTTAKIGVEFAQDPRRKLWLPKQMEEEYTITDVAGRPVAEIFGRAIYSNVRKFDVVVDEKVTE